METAGAQGHMLPQKRVPLVFTAAERTVVGAEAEALQ